MELLSISERTSWNLELIHQGGFIKAKAKGWQDFKNGLVAYVDEKILRAFTFSGVHCAGNYISIKAAEVASGMWEIIYSNDLEETYGTDNPEAISGEPGTD